MRCAQGFDSGETPGFGPGSLIPSPFDPRLILRIAPAVAKAAMEIGVATRPITEFRRIHRRCSTASSSAPASS